MKCFKYVYKHSWLNLNQTTAQSKQHCHLFHCYFCSISCELRSVFVKQRNQIWKLSFRKNIRALQIIKHLFFTYRLIKEHCPKINCNIFKCVWVKLSCALHMNKENSWLKNRCRRWNHVKKDTIVSTKSRDKNSAVSFPKYWKIFIHFDY